MTAFFPLRRKPRAFTLVEMLTVIIIIGILASLMLVAFGAARNRTRIATIKVEISELAMVFERYRQEHGEYPPDFSGVADSDTSPGGIREVARQAVLRHLRKRFPRYRLIGTVDQQWQAFALDVWNATRPVSAPAFPSGDPGMPTATDRGLYVTEFDPRAAIVFWLGGLPATFGSTELTGFNMNPTAPFAVGGNRTPRLFEFSSDRLGYANNWLAGNAQASIPIYGSFCTDRQPIMEEQFAGRTSACPYYYFRAYPGSVGYYWLYPVRPYGDSRNNGQWMNRDSFQIVSAGLDGGFGATGNDQPPVYPSGENFTSRYPTDAAPPFSRGLHEDNITNFTENATIKDDMP